MYVVVMGDAAKTKAIELIKEFRANGISADTDYTDRKMKAQMKTADRQSAKYVIVLGDSELEEQAVNVKEMETGNQEKVAFSDLVNYVLQK